MKALQWLLLLTMFTIGGPLHARTNVALNKPATQSSEIAAGYTASQAVDGDRSTISHTNNDNQSWLEVDLQSVYNIDMVAILNRQDCCQERLADFYVLVSNVPFLSTDLDTARAQSGVSSYFFPGAGGPQPNFYIGRTGRYVRVQLSSASTSQSFLQIAELQVFDSDSGFNAAMTSRGGVSSASSTYTDYPGYDAFNANDGYRANGNSDNRGVFWNSNCNVLPEWWQVKLQLPQSIRQVNVFTFQDDPQNNTEPTTSTTFATYGMTDYDVQYWSGTAWVNVTGGHVTGNDKVWRQFSFTPVTTDRIRVVVNGVLQNCARIAEVEAVADTPIGIVNGSFEVPPIAPDYGSPDGTGWNYSGSSGVSKNATGYTGGNPNAPDGAQVLILQGAGAAQQTFALPAGSYALTFKAAQRGSNQDGPQTIQASIDGSVIGTVQPVSTSYGFLQIPFTVASGGSHVLRLAGMTSDGSDRTAFVDDVRITIPTVASLIAAYRFDEASWNGTAGEVVDVSGNGHNGAASGAPMPATGTGAAALTGSPGTCGYATLPAAYNGGIFTLPGLPTSTAVGDKTTVAFWMLYDGSNQDSNVVSFGTYSLFIYNGYIGFHTDAQDGWALAFGSQLTGWHHITAIFANGDSTASELWIDGVKATLSGGTGQNTANAVASPTLTVGSKPNRSNQHFVGSIDELYVFDGATSSSQIAALMSARHSCGGAQVGAFNAFETATTGGAITGVVHTKVSASNFGLDVVAIDSTLTAVLPNFSGTVKVELIDASDNSGTLTDSCRASWVPLAGDPGTTLSFSGSAVSRSTVSLMNAEAWRDVRVRVSYPATGTPTLVACSSDDFAIRPASLAGLSATDATSSAAGSSRTLSNVTATGGVVHKSGQPFSIQAVAVNAISATTARYTGTPSLVMSACGGNACVPLGTLTGSPTAVAGVINSSASYDEVGSFALQLVDTSFASVDAGDGSSAAERTISSPVANVGRFVPDHFDVTSLAAPVLRTFGSSSCVAARSFTYVGQPFGFATVAQATVTAKNAAGNTTVNYAGSLWKLAASSLAQSYASTPASPALDASAVNAATLTSNGDGTGLFVSAAADMLRFTRPSATPVAPFNANIALNWSVTDASETGVSGNGSISTTTPLVFSNIPFDAGNQMRFGVLRLTPAYGSELIDLPVRVEAQYWDGQRMATNAADSCTALPAATLAMSNYQRSLAACKTAVSAPLTLLGGRTFAKLAKPGNGNNGSVDLALQLGASASGQTCTAVGGSTTAAATANLPWLQGKWSGAGAFDQNPATRASFGQYRSPMIYQREMF